MSPIEWWTEVRQAARRLRRAPGFSVIVVLTLALGVGANTAIFSVLDAVLFEALPYPESDRLVRVYEGRVDNPTLNLTYLRAPVVAEYRRWDEVFENFGAVYTYREIGADLTDGDAAQRVTVSRISSDFFETLGIAPARGRMFSEEESYGPGEATSTTAPIERVAIISHGLWINNFAGDPDIVGRIVHLDGFGFEVVGVMPRGFTNPFGSKADLWVPQDLRSGGSNSFGNFYLSGVGRLKDGVTIEAARERLAVLSMGFAEAQPEMENDVPRIFPLQADLVGSTRRAMLWILAAAAALVLLTACVNVANLLFARGLEQDRHLALRSALGSGRARLIAGILSENGLLAAAGGVVGLGLGWIGVKVLVRLAPDALPMIAEPEVGGSVFLFAFVVTVGALLAFGLAPAIRLSRTAPAEVLRSGDRSATVGQAARRLRDFLVVVQVAAALMLVAGAGLLTRSFNTLLDVPLGIEPEGVLTFEVHLPAARYAEGAERQTFHERLQERVASLAAVESAGATSWLPVNGRYHSWMLYWDPENPDRSNDDGWVPTDVRVVAGDYFGSMGIDVIAGDDFRDADFEVEPMVWINQAIVDEVFDGADAIGRQIYIAGADRRIMGVVENIPFDARGEVSNKVYVPHAQYSDNRNWAMIQTVRARGDLTEVLEQIRGELRSLDSDLVLYRPKTFEAVLATVRAQDRFATVLMGSFAALSLLLSVVGIYGVLSGTVASRTREIGIRMALGADAREVRGMVMRHAAGVTIPGVLLGLVGAWFGSRWISALLFDVAAVDLVAYGGAVVIFVAVGMFSGWLPAVRATRVDTVEALTAE
ncbi:MAG: ABC transporter permease [Longimicrobiales bacterium]